MNTTTDKPTPEPVDVVKQEFEKQFAHMDLTSYGGKMYNSKRTNNVYIGFKRAWNMRDVSPDEPSELRQAGVDDKSELFDQQKSAGHDFTVNDEGMAFCKQCGDFMTFPAKPCSKPHAKKPTEVEREEVIGYWHEVTEPNGEQASIFSREEKNPWAHWQERHKNGCVFKVTPLVALQPAAQKTEGATIEQAYENACKIAGTNKVTFEHSGQVYTVYPARLGRKVQELETALASRASVDVVNLKDRVADIIGAEYSSEGVNAEDFARDVAKSTIDHLAAKFPELVGGRE